MSEVADYMRGLGFFPSDYQIECLHHELQITGKRKVGFEELVKLYINHTPFSPTNFAMEKSLKVLLDLPTTQTTNDVVIRKSQIISILTESAEKIDEKDAKLYLKELLNGCGNFSEEIPLFELLHAMQDSSSGNNGLCITESCK